MDISDLTPGQLILIGIVAVVLFFSFMNGRNGGNGNGTGGGRSTGGSTGGGTGGV